MFFCAFDKIWLLCLAFFVFASVCLDPSVCVCLLHANLLASGLGSSCSRVAQHHLAVVRR